MKALYYASEPDQQLVVAVRSSDYVRTTQIIAEQISRTTGSERAFWLFVRVGQWGVVATEANIRRAWADLEEALQTAPEDPEVRETALYTALGYAVMTEKLERLLAVVRQVRPDLPRLKQDWRYWHNVGDLHGLKGHWRQAYGACQRALDSFHRQSSQAVASFQGYLPLLYCRRAIGAAACGDAAQAAQDIQTAEEQYTRVSAPAQNPLAVAMAAAELALCQGRLGQARAALQLGVEKAGLKLNQPDDRRLVQVDLLAGRIARADGNAAGFRHFCERALARTQTLDLAFSAARIRRVLEGAER